MTENEVWEFLDGIGECAVGGWKVYKYPADCCQIYSRTNRKYFLRGSQAELSEEDEGLVREFVRVWRVYLASWTAPH